MTRVIQLFAHPGAYPTHGVWITVLLSLIARGGGMLSLDHLLACRFAISAQPRSKTRIR
jgi:putative oxidoreductase